jgi:hypothetical protein
LVKYVIDFFFKIPSRKDYISKYVDYIFNVSVKETYEEFHRGFYKVCNWNIIRLFQPEELMKAIIGNTDYDWKQFENVGDTKHVPSFFQTTPIYFLLKNPFSSLSRIQCIVENTTNLILLY